MIADDAVLLREGAARLLAEAGHEVVAQAGDADDPLRKVRANTPDVAIIDVRISPDNRGDGLRAALAITGGSVLDPEVVAQMLGGPRDEGRSTRSPNASVRCWR